jgi:hypothetical protein
VNVTFDTRVKRGAFECFTEQCCGVALPVQISIRSVHHSDEVRKLLISNVEIHIIEFDPMNYWSEYQIISLVSTAEMNHKIEGSNYSTLGTWIKRLSHGFNLHDLILDICLK